MELQIETIFLKLSVTLFSQVQIVLFPLMTFEAWKAWVTLKEKRYCDVSWHQPTG
jgi:hypothetical protein